MSLHSKAEGSELLVIQGMNHVLKEVEGDLAAQLPSYFNPELPLHKKLGVGILKFVRNIETEQGGDSDPE